MTIQPVSALVRVVLTVDVVAALVVGSGGASWSDEGGRSTSTRADAQAPSVYVATGGSDTGAGTLFDPYATFQHAVEQLGAVGGTVVARGGTYAGQRLVMQGVRHVTVEAYPGEQPVLDLSGTVAPLGSSGVVEIRDGADLTVRGLEITGYRTASQSRVPVGVYVVGAPKGVTIEDNHVHHLGNDNQERGSSDINAHGIAVYGTNPDLAVRGLTIVGNEVDHLALGASESVVVNGNVKGWRIVGNFIHHNNNIGIDAIGFESTLAGTARWTDANRARRGLIAHNVVTDIVSRGNPAYWESPGWCNCADGIYVDGGMDIVIRDNIVRGSDIGIEAASEWKRGGTERIRIVGNHIAGSAYVGLALGGYGPERGEAFDLVVKRNILIGNNTLDDGSPEILIQFKVHDTRISRNSVTATNNSQPALVRRVRRVGTHAQNDHVRLDHNDYGVPGSPQRARFSDGVEQYTGLSAWRRGTGQDQHSIIARRSREVVRSR